MTDKNIEKKRYDDRAIKLIEANNFEVPLGLHSYMMEPIDSYKKNLLANVFNGARVLEIGAGMGENTEFLLNQGFNVHATDISSKSVEFLKKNMLHIVCLKQRLPIWSLFHLKIIHLM